MRLIVVEIPGAKRGLDFDAAASSLTAPNDASDTAVDAATDGHRVEKITVSWAEVIRVEGRLDALPAFDGAAAVRLDSPGGDDSVARALMRLAARAEPDRFAARAADVDYVRGEIRPQAQLHFGLRVVLRNLQASLSKRPDLRPWTRPTAIATMLDKHATRLWLQSRGIAVPDGFAPATWEALEAGRQARGWREWFVKLRYGSCGSGIVRLSEGVDGAPVGVGTAHERDGLVLDAGRPRRFDSEAVEVLVRRLLDHGVVAEPAIRLLRVDGQRFDLRVVVIRDGPCLPIFRRSVHPVTNLYLGGRRADPEACRRVLGRARYLDGIDLARDAASVTGARVVGVDVVFDDIGAYVLELNPFGDFFPGWTDADGHSIAALSLRAWLMHSDAGDPRGQDAAPGAG